MSNVTPNTSVKSVAPVSSSAGKTTIEDGVVAKIVGIAAREVPGVYALGGGAARALGAIRDALNTTDLTQGVNVEVGEKQVAVDVTIVAAYPEPLQKIADRVRSAVYRAVEELVGLEVTEVNITINDVHLPSDDAKSEDKSDDNGQGARVQ